MPLAASSLSPSVPIDQNSVTMTLRRPIAVLAAAAAFALGVASIPRAAAQSDADFLAAKAAYDRSDRAALDGLAPRLAGHVLEPYVRYWQLRLRVDSADEGAIRAFLASEAGGPLADELRVAWLKSLALRGRRDTFGEELPKTASEDVELACFAAQFRRQSEGDAALAAVKPLWFTGRSQPDSCAPLFDALIAKGDLSTADRIARMRLAAANGNVRLAQAIGTALPPRERIAERDFARVERDPLAALDRAEFALKQPAGRELALYAVERAARKDPQAARAAWVKVRPLLPEAERSYGNGRVAFHAARQHVPDANVWYREAAGAALSDEQHAWRVRAALRAQDMGDVAAAIDAMPAALAQDPAWRYWRARAHAAAGRAEEAKRLHAELAKEFHFYGLLSAEAIGAPFAIPERAAPPSAEDVAAFGARPSVVRVVKLAQLGLRAESLREWIPVLRNAPDELLLVAAEYARRQGLHDRAINTADRTVARHDFALRYLTPYPLQFGAAAKAHDVDEAVLFAIARQESRFVADIVSSAGAQGLMQIMPATARWIAKQLGDTGYRPSQITDPELNTRYGAFYFRHVLERLDNQPALAAAAYNAGPGRAQAWRPAAPLEGAAWVETIPFNETRDYVKKVLANLMVYSHSLGRPAQSLTARLATVAPRGANGNALAGTP
jgi:soluble lytic murein transglycosylase